MNEETRTEVTTETQETRPVGTSTEETTTETTRVENE